MKQLSEQQAETKELKRSVKDLEKKMKDSVASVAKKNVEIGALKDLVSVHSKELEDVIDHLKDLDVLALVEIIRLAKFSLRRLADPSGEYDDLTKDCVEAGKDAFNAKGITFGENHRKFVNRLQQEERVPNAHPTLPPTQEEAEKLLYAILNPSDKLMAFQIIQAYYKLRK